MSDQGTPVGPRKRWWQTVAGWHTGDDKLWREIYARTLSTLLAGFIAYLIGVWAGALDPRPLRLALLILSGIALVSATITWLAWFSHVADRNRDPWKPRRFLRVTGLALLFFTSAYSFPILWTMYKAHAEFGALITGHGLDPRAASTFTSALVVLLFTVGSAFGLVTMLIGFVTWHEWRQRRKNADY